MSGGEAQRASVAVALANQPDLLLADEVTGQLDSTNAEQVMAVIFDAWQRLRGVTVLYVTHNVELAARAERRLDPGGRRGTRSVNAGADVELDDVTKGVLRPALG